MGFKKAAAKQAALKLALYGPPGSGKSYTALLVAEGLAKYTHKRIAYVDTEHGTDFYSKAVPSRKHHPEAFDFDALWTRSLTEVVRELKALKADEYGVAVVDSITHMWEAARAAYGGNTNKVGAIPMHAWGTIKRPYKELITFLLNSPMHVIICGRQGQEYAEDETTGELKNVGVKLKAEGETAYEPHILIRMEAVRQGKGKGEAVPTAFVEKDRTGVLQGMAIAWPTFDNVAAPILGLLGGEQAQLPDEDAVAAQDADALARTQQARANRSANLLTEFQQKYWSTKSADDVERVRQHVLSLRKDILAEDLTKLRTAHAEALDRVKGAAGISNGSSDRSEAGS